MEWGNRILRIFGLPLLDMNNIRNFGRGTSLLESSSRYLEAKEDIHGIF